MDAWPAFPRSSHVTRMNYRCFASLIDANAARLAARVETRGLRPDRRLRKRRHRCHVARCRAGRQRRQTNSGQEHDEERHVCEHGRRAVMSGFDFAMIDVLQLSKIRGSCPPLTRP